MKLRDYSKWPTRYQQVWCAAYGAHFSYCHDVHIAIDVANRAVTALDIQIEREFETLLTESTKGE